MKHCRIACPCKPTLCLIQLLQPSLVVAAQSLNQMSPENQQMVLLVPREVAFLMTNLSMLPGDVATRTITTCMHTKLEGMM